MSLVNYTNDGKKTFVEWLKFINRRRMHTMIIPRDERTIGILNEIKKIEWPKNIRHVWFRRNGSQYLN